MMLEIDHLENEEQRFDVVLLKCEEEIKLLEILGSEDSKKEEQLSKIVPKDEEVCTKIANKERKDEKVFKVSNEFENFELNCLEACVDIRKELKSSEDWLLEDLSLEDCVTFTSLVQNEIVVLWEELSLLEERLINQRMHIQCANLNLEDEEIVMKENIESHTARNSE